MFIVSTAPLLEAIAFNLFIQMSKKNLPAFFIF